MQVWCKKVHGSSFLGEIGGEGGEAGGKLEGFGGSLKKPLQGKEKVDYGNIGRLVGRAAGNRGCGF